MPIRSELHGSEIVEVVDSMLSSLNPEAKIIVSYPSNTNSWFRVLVLGCNNVTADISISAPDMAVLVLRLAEWLKEHGYINDTTIPPPKSFLNVLSYFREQIVLEEATSKAKLKLLEKIIALSASDCTKEEKV